MSIRPFLPTGGKVTPMQMLIFIQLLRGPKFGYEILRNLRDDFEGVWIPKTGSVYPALRTLLKKGLLSKENKKGKTYYSLSDSGLEFVRNTHEFVKDYILFNYTFMKVAAQRLPPDFTASVLQAFLELGIDDMIPGDTVIEAVRDIEDTDVRLFLLKERERILMEKAKAIGSEIRKTKAGDSKKKE
jgi:DNA-binding PadR family transcriptional regulator